MAKFFVLNLMQLTEMYQDKFRLRNKLMTVYRMQHMTVHQCNFVAYRWV